MTINCRQCTHFYITWDKNFPYGCKAFGLKTKRIPSAEVYLSSGKDCLKFTPKENHKDRKK
ncbi:MAG: uracil-DNA glycosylase [Ignavibacteria bacterium]|nr:uracil-DNA glycosylase [Ignavibacteria bacterium]